MTRVLHGPARFAWPVVLIVLTQFVSAQTSFSVTDAGKLVQLNRIGDGSTAVGFIASKYYTWDPIHVLEQVPNPQGGFGTHLNDVNSSGRAVGYADFSDGPRRAVTWTRSGGTSVLFDLGGPFAEANSVNDFGEAVGRLQIVPNEPSKAFFWSPTTGARLLPPLEPNKPAEAWMVNNAGEAAGSAGFGEFGITSVVWAADGTVSEMGNMTGQTQTNGADLNNLGYITGTSFGQFNDGGFVRDPSGNFTRIQNPAWPGAFTYGTGINDSLVVVGRLLVSAGVYKGFVWSYGRGTVVLNNALDPLTGAGWDIVQAQGVNNLGQICGIGKLNGEFHGFVLDPVLMPVAPTSVTVSLGKLNAGSAASLATVDGDVLRVCKFLVPNLVVAPVDVKLDGTFSSGNCLGLTLRLVSRMQQAGAFSQTLNLWDWTAGDWDAKDVRVDPVNTTFIARDLVADGDTRRLLKSDGSLRARYRVKQTGPAATVIWCHEMDQAVWLVAP